MTRRSIRPAALIAVTLAAVTSVMAPTVPSAGATVGHAAAAAAPTSTSVDAPRIVALPTGQRFLGQTGAGGERYWSPLDRFSGGDHASILRLGDRTLVLPSSARQRIGRALDPSQFDLDAIDRAAGGTARRAETTPRHTDPRYPMHTLTVRATGLDGKPLSGAQVLVVCASDIDRYLSFVTLPHGVAKISVPTGTYVVMSQQDFGATETRVAYSPEFPVTSDRAASLDFRKATTRFVSRLPGRATIARRITEFDRTYRFGDMQFILGLGLIDSGERVLRVTPTPKPKYGIQTINQYEEAFGPGGFTGGRYGLYFGHTDAIPANDIVEVADDANLATVRTTLYGSAQIDAAVFGRAVRSRDAGSYWGFADPVAAPMRFTEYVSAGTDLRSSANYVVDATEAGARGWIDTTRQRLRGDRRYRLDLGRGPLHGGFLPINRDSFCSSCIDDDQVTLMGYLGGDSEPGHVGAADLVDPPTQTWTITADGRPLAAGSGMMTDSVAALPSGAKNVGLRMSLDRGGAPFTTSTHIDTTWSTPTTATAPLGDGIYCALDGPCRVLRFVSARYDLATDLHGTVRAGRHRMEIALTLSDGSPARDITTARLRMNYGGGWVSTPVTQVAEGRYAASLIVPRALGAADLDLTVATASGARLRERVTSGFRFRP